MARTPLENIQLVAEALGPLCSEVVFVGGATLELYLEKPQSEPPPAIRPTLDVDFMPTDSSILGFTNSWYSEGFSKAATVALPSGAEIRILPLRYLIATKCEAFFQRGARDLYASKDLEDIIFLLAFGKSVREELRSAPIEIREALDRVRGEIESKHALLEIVEAHIDRSANAGTKQQVVDLLQIVL